MKYDFAAGTTLSAGEALLVTAFNPANVSNSDRLASFRAHYGLDAGVTLVGGYSGHLDDNGQLVGLEGPDVEEFAREIGAHAGSLVALHRKLKRLENFPFMVSKLTDGDVVDRIMEYLDRGINVVLEFGQQTSMLCYLLVANIIARRIHEMYVKKSERFYATQKPEDQPRQMMITIEEAHKFLNPSAAKQTIFGTIAREMRKYYVSLLIVDQRPSSIDDEVLSQIGTRITALLNDEKDIQAVPVSYTHLTLPTSDLV